jgi:bifunctional UDP-N-acetylglucosamine pyrophosphorylase/glucosamine-1-phosphate N-acetyltransferase
MAARSQRGRLQALILAAGQGKRMRSERIKLLHVVGGAPMVAHVARAAAALKPDLLAAVVGNQAEEVSAALTAEGGGRGIRFVSQSQQLGTAHAVLQAELLMDARGGGRADVLILNGDVPLIRPATLRALLRHHRGAGAAATVLTTRVDDPTGYGRVVRDEAGAFVRIVEQRDASAEEAVIDEINAGLYCADAALLFPALKRIGRDNVQKEYYLPDLFPILRGDGLRVEAYVHDDPHEVLGVNDRAELALAGKTLYLRRALELMDAGVTIVDPACTYIEPTVKIGRDSVVHPMAHLQGRTVIGRGCSIGAMVHITDSRLGDGVQVLDSCVISQARVASAVRIGPFAHLRPGTVLEEEVHVGNFVEVKKSRLGRGTKANHLSYLGDAAIGKRCNIGAGTITCNYDGYRKLPTRLGDEVFIGSDTQLVAPVTVRSGAYVGAGSTITRDVPRDALALTRAEMTIRKDWARKYKERMQRERARKDAVAKEPQRAAPRARGKR